MHSSRILIEAQERDGGLDGGVQAIESAPETALALEPPTVVSRGRVVESATIGADASVCFGPLRGGYEALRLRVNRGVGVVRPPMQVHVRDAARVVGVLRMER